MGWEVTSGGDTGDRRRERGQFGIGGDMKKDSFRAGGDRMGQERTVGDRRDMMGWEGTGHRKGTALGGDNVGWEGT